MGYTTWDFSESLDRVKLDADDIERVIAAWGVSLEGYADWTGGFFMLLSNGQHAYLTGWCDTSGWGCRDGAELTRCNDLPALEFLDSTVEWDEDPADLNRYVQGLISKHDTPV